MIRTVAVKDLPGPTPTIVFICGTPRSGTTILYQSLVRCGQVGYISNLIARFASNPRLGVRLAQALDLPKVFTGQSTFGRTEHITEPHEFGRGWLDLLRLETIRQPQVPYRLGPGAAGRIEQLARTFDQPVVFKSFAYQWFIRELTESLPSARWVYISRDTREAAKSLEKLYRCRARCGGGAKWHSAVMRNTMARYGELSLGDRCLRQIEDMVCFLEGEFESIDPDRRAQVHLDDFRRDPRGTVRRLLWKFEIPYDAKALEVLA
jgi:hypothetical protein